MRTTDTTAPHRRRAAFAAGIAAIALGATIPLTGASAATAAEVAPTGACEAGWYFNPTSRSTDTFAPVGPQQANPNGTGSASQDTFTASVSGTVSVEVSGSVNVGVDAKVASIGAEYGISAAASVTAEMGNSTTITVPAGQTGFAQYGVHQAVVQGVEQYRTPACTVTSTRQTTVVAPYGVGWSTWTG